MLKMSFTLEKSKSLRGGGEKSGVCTPRESAYEKPPNFFSGCQILVESICEFLLLTHLVAALSPDE